MPKGSADIVREMRERLKTETRPEPEPDRGMKVLRWMLAAIIVGTTSVGVLVARSFPQ